MTVVIATGSAIEADLQWVPQGPGRRLALIGIAVVAGTVVLAGRFLPEAVPDHRPAPASESAAPDTLPPDPAIFVGRNDDLSALLRYHADALADGVRQGPVKLLVDGLTGAGKSALALRLAYQIAAHYPDGRLYCKMSTVGRERRDLGDMLGALLVHLGRIDAMSKSTEERIGLYRTETANKRILLVLDGARDDAQVKALLPTGRRCAVIVSSRRSLAAALDASSHPLSPPTALEAAEILRQHLPEEANAPADTVARITDVCGRLPMALVTVSEQVRQREGGLRDVATLLASPRGRMQVLGRQPHDVGLRITRDIVARLAAEFERLLPSERRAAVILTTVKTATFVPWVLQPLLELGPAEASSLMAALRFAHFLDSAQMRQTEFARYRFNPLVKSFVETRLNSEFTEIEIEQARDRLRRATLACSAAVLRVVDEIPAEDQSLAVNDAWLPDIEDWPETIAAERRFWATAEFPSLIDAMLVANAEGREELCWRLGRQLLGCGTAAGEAADIDRAFAVSVECAERSGASAGDSIRLARGVHLVSAGSYDSGLELIDQVARSSAGKNVGLAFLACKLKAEALERVGLLAAAIAALELAREQALAGGLAAFDVGIVEMLLAADRAIITPSAWMDDIAAIVPYAEDHKSRPDVQVKVALVDAACRRRRWDDAFRRLGEATLLALPDGNLRAYLAYKHASIVVQQLAPGGGGDTSHAPHAVGLAAQAVAAYMALANVDGELRTRGLLAEACLRAGKVDECAAQVEKAWRMGTRIGRELTGEYWQTFRAQLLTLEGEVMAARGDCSLALAPLDQAIELYARCGMFWNRANVQVILGRTLGLLGQRTRALCVLHAALWRFDQCGDSQLADSTWREIEAVAH